MASFPLQVDAASPFPIENIPFGIFSLPNDSTLRAGTAIGSWVLDLAALEKKGLFAHVSDLFGAIFSKSTLNEFASLSRSIRINTRQSIIELLSDGSSILFTDATLNKEAFHPLSDVQLHVPMDIPEFTDFSCYEEHVRNCFTMSKMNFGPQATFYTNPLAYNGRTSSIIPSGVNVHRLRGLYKDSQGYVAFKPCASLDYELEMGFFLSKSLPWGKTMQPDEAEEYIFGFVLVNDWSARDILAYEMIPAGPFNSKAFATSISPWVVVPEALLAARTSPINQQLGQVPSYLRHKSLFNTTYDIDTSVYMTRSGKTAVRVSTTNFSHAYFSPGQALAHRASSGCGLRVGELLALGTISSPAENQIDSSVNRKSCLFELTLDGTQEVPISGGKWLQDGDRVTFEAWARGENGVRIGFGELTGKILPCTE